MFAALETRRQPELVAQAATLAENPTLKAALDTYQAEAATGSAVEAQLLETISRELTKVAARIESDAIVLVDMHQNTLAAAGRLGDRWPRGRPIALSTTRDGNTIDGIARLNGSTFRVVSVPLRVSDGTTIRIVHVADAYDAMTSARAYRAARPSGDAGRELWRCAGTEFHAEIVGALASALPGVTSDVEDVVLEPV